MMLESDEIKAQPSSLEAFQNHLNVRLSESVEKNAPSPLLAMRVAGKQWLLEPSDLEGLDPISEITPVPLTRSSFLGLANVRGSLYAVSDFNMLAGGEATPLEKPAMFLLIHPKYGVNAALLFVGMVSLRGRDMFVASDKANDIAQEDLAWCAGHCYEQEDNPEPWRKVGVSALLASRDFKEITL